MYPDGVQGKSESDEFTEMDFDLSLGWGDIWLACKQLGWSHCTGDLVDPYFYLKPGCKKAGSEFGIDKFRSPEHVMAYLEALQAGTATGKVPAPSTLMSIVPEDRKKRRRARSGSLSSSSPRDRHSSTPQAAAYGGVMGRKAKAGKGGGRGKKSRKLKVPSSVAPSPGGGDMPRAKAADKKMVHIFHCLRAMSMKTTSLPRWTLIFHLGGATSGLLASSWAGHTAGDLVDPYFYLKPGCKKAGSEFGVDKFRSPEHVMAYLEALQAGTATGRCRLQVH